MQTIGQLLQSLRKKQGFSLEAISQETKIAPHLLEFLEQDDFLHLPSSTFTKGFIVTYAKVVGLSSSKALAIFRRDFTVDESGKIMPRGLAKPLDKPTYVASKLLWTGFISLFLILFGAYVWFQIRQFNAPPSLTVQRPNANAIVKGPIVMVKGHVSAETSVFVNEELAEIFPTGEFRSSVQLPPGENQIQVKAVNSQQKSTGQTIPVTVVDK